MKTFTVFGASDDLIEASGVPGADEFNVCSNSKLVARFDLKSHEGSVAVYCIYHGHWCFAVGALEGDDYDFFPNWPIRRTWGNDKAYSETLEIDVPDDTELVNFKKSR